MWILKLSMTTLWMAGMVAGWTLGGVLHLLALAVVALVFVEETPFEKKLGRLRFDRPQRFLSRNITHVSSSAATRAWPITR